jgi:hypothetical protein
MKNIALERLLFGYFFLAVEEKVTGSKGFVSKTAWRWVSAALAFVTPLVCLGWSLHKIIPYI